MDFEKANKSCLLSTTYFGNLQYFSKFLIFKNIIIEQFENFYKQTYRNRFEILSANGKISLSIPLINNSNHKTHIKDIKVDYATNWQKIHYKSLESAYSSSPYFEYYIDNFNFVFTKKEKYLLDLNNKITIEILNILGINSEIKCSEDFYENHEFDYRNFISPKIYYNIDNSFVDNKYYQVFKEKFEFVGNLSILDLIFNMGPDTLDVLKNSIK